MLALLLALALLGAAGCAGLPAERTGESGAPAAWRHSRYGDLRNCRPFAEHLWCPVRIVDRQRLADVPDMWTTIERFGEPDQIWERSDAPPGRKDHAFVYQPGSDAGFVFLFENGTLAGVRSETGEEWPV
jgi:hypothetical protein